MTPPIRELLAQTTRAVADTVSSWASSAFGPVGRSTARIVRPIGNALARGLRPITRRIPIERIRAARADRIATLLASEPERSLSAVALPTLPNVDRAGFAGRSFLMLGVVVLAVVGVLLAMTQLQNARNQRVAYDEFRTALASATAPVSATGLNSRLLPLGTPVALIEIPSIGVKAVVVEGTSSEATMLGPGHRRDTPLPGQTGVSVIYGRQFSYGAVFAQLDQLVPGDEIRTVTAQGESTYEVTDLRSRGEAPQNPPATNEGRLTLVSAAGPIPLVPSDVLRVDAKLTSKPWPTPLGEFPYTALPSEDEAMQGNPAAWPLLTLGMLASLAALIISALLRRHWGRWQTWVVAVPTMTALVFFTVTQLATLLPNIL